MTVKANKIFRSLVAIIICISMLLLPIPMEKLGINIGNGVVRADVTEADLAAMVGLLDDYALITAGDYNSSWGSHIMGPVAIGGDFYGQGVSLANNQSNSYFAPRTYDFVLGGSFVDVSSNPSFVQLNVVNEFYLVASHSGSNFYTNQNETGAGFNTTSGTLSDGTDYYAYDDYGTSEHPLPIDFDKMIDAAKAWSSSFDEYCSDTSNTDVQQITNTGSKLELVGTDSDINYFNIDNTATGSTQLYITVPDASSKIIINTDGYWDVSEYYLMFSDTDTDYSRVYPEQYSASTNDDYERWYIENLVFTSDDSSIDPTALLAGVLIAPNCDASVSSYYCSSWIVNSIEAKYSCFDIYGSSLARFGWNSWIPTTPPSKPSADIEVSLVDDSDPAKDITSLCSTNPSTYFVLVDDEGNEVKKAAYENGKVIFKGVPVSEDEYSVIQFGYPEDSNGTPYVTVDGGATSITVEVTDKDTYVVTGGLGETDNKVIFQNRLSRYVDFSVKVVDGDNTSTALENAVIEVDDGNSVITTFTTGTDGIGVDTNSSTKVRLYEKTEYTVTETTVPTDYVANPDTFVITVDSEGDLIINSENIDVPTSMSYSLLIKNVKPKSFDVTVYTVDENDEPISGIDVTITNKDNSTITYTLTTDGTGKVVFEDIPEGDYEIEQDESDIPKNHEADDENPKELTIPHDYDENTVTKFVNSTTPVVVNIKVVGSDGTVFEDVPVRIEISGITDPVIVETDANGIATYEGKEGYSYTITDSLTGTTYVADYKSSADEAPITGSIAVGSDTINLTLTHKKLATNDIVAVTKVGDTATGGFEVTLYDSTGTTVIAGPEETGTDGKYTFEDMTEGTYIVKVTDKDGYTLQSERAVTVSYDSTTSSFNTATFTFAEVEGSISGTVTDDATSPNPMEGVTVTLYDSLGNQVGSSVTTNSDGEYKFTEVVIGEYTVKVSDYTDSNSFVWTATSTNPKDAEVSSSTTDVTDVNFVMAKKTVTMTVSVVDGSDNALTKSVDVTVEDANGFTDTKTTSTGSVTFTVPVGVIYTVSDTTPDGYKPSTSQTVPVDATATSASATLKHTKINTVTITCYAKDDKGTLLSGAQLTLTNTETSEVFGGQTFTTDATGKIVFENVPEGKYTLVEVQPTGYEADAQPTRNLTIYPSSTSFQQNFTNAKILGSVSGIVKDDSGNPISGVTITLLDKDKNPITGYTTTTDTNGEYEFEDLDIAKYFVKETTPTGYEDATVNPVEVTLTATSKTGTANFTNEYILKEVPLTITVYDKDKTPNEGISGVSVTVTDVNDSTNTYTGTTTTGGTVTINVLEGSTYRITDIAPSGYAAANPSYDDVTIDIGDTSAIGALYHSAVPTATVVVEITNNSTYDTSALTGTEVRYGDSVNPTTGTKVTLTDVSDVATGTIELSEGTYYFKEIAPQTGFKSTDGDLYYKVVVDADGEATITPIRGGVEGSALSSNKMTFNNTEILGSITVTVSDSSSTAVKDVEITLCDENGDPITSISPITTGTDGKVTFSDLPLGTYKVLETVPDGYKADTTNPKTVVLTTTNINGTATFTNAKINVVDVVVTVVDDKGTPISGVSVTIKDKNTDDTYTTTSTTDVNGKVTIENVPEGSYVVFENDTPNGYNKANDEDLTITSTMTKGEVTLTNARIMGSISGKVTDDAATPNAMEGVTVTLYDSTGAKVGESVKTNSAGEYEFTDLTIGEYSVEVSDFTATDSSLWKCCTTNPQDAEITATTPAVTGINFGMSKTLGSITVEVKDSDTTAIEGVTITICDENGDPITSISPITTGTDGKVTFSDLPLGTYKVLETVPDGYKADTTNPKTVVLTTTNINGTATFTNAKINVVDVVVTVVDDKGTPISGVSVTITDTVTGDTYTTTSTTDVNGKVTIEDVPEGKYEVTEVSTPAGYNDATPKDLEITSTTTKGEVTLTNARITGAVTVNVFNTSSNNSTVLTGTTIIYSTSSSFTSPTTVTLTDGTTVATADINLLPGTYYFKLSAPQDGYLQDYTYVLYYQAVVDAKGTVTIYERFDESGYLYTRSQKIDGNVMNFYCSTETGTVSGTVTSDGTTPIANVTIYLRDEKGNNVKTTTTAADGTYSFANVRKGTYYVVEKVPDKYHDPVSNNVETILTSDKLTASVNFINAPVTVSGNVTGTDSTPLEGVTVTLKNSYGTPVGTATTDKDGNYTIEGVSNGTYTVTISNSDGYLPTDSKSATVSSKKDVTDLDFAPVPNKLSGTVTGTDVNGDPADLDGLVVTITDSKGNTRTTTVTNGAYEFTKVSNETYTVSVEAKDTYEAFDDQTGIVVANDNKTANFTTTPVSVSGTLVDENNQPIAGQTITITDANGSHNVTTKTDGTYSFAGVANGEITIAVSNVDGYVPFTNLTPTVAGKSLTGQNFKAVPSTISGTVTGTDASGNPANLDGLKVTIEDSQGHTQTTTVENGKYEFTKVPNETYTVSVEQKDTYVAFDDQTGIVVANDKKTANFTTAPLTVSGKLVDENGQPIAGQTITLTDKNGTYNVTTEADGTYSFTGVANGDISITSTVPDGYNYTGKINASVAGTSLKNMNFATKPTVVSGTAMDEDGVTPLPNQTVTVTDKNGKTYTATTGTDGSYSVSGVVDGAITIAITTPEGYNTISSLTNTVAGKDLPNQNFKGHKTVVSGTAMDEDGVTPLVGETVTVTDKNGTTYTATTGTDGSYSVSGVVDGDITIAITTPNGYDTISNLTNTVAGKDLTNQNFKGVPTEVSGNVTDTDGNPLENVEVQLVDKNDPTNVIGPVKTDSDGDFITTKVPNGIYDVVVVTPDGYKPVNPIEITVNNDSHKNLTFTPAPTEVTGNVTDTDGNPLENVEVQLVDKNDPTNVIGPVKTDSDGDFITTNVPNGDYDVVVITPDGYKPVDPVEITVKNDDHGPLTFTPDASRVSGNVTDTDDTPLDGVEIQLVDPNDPTNVIDTTTTDSNGDYEFKNVPNDDYKVVVVTPDGYKPVDPKDITVKNDDHLKTDFTPDVTRVSGTVADDEGTGLDGVTVKIVDPNDPTKVIDTTTTGTDGNYEFKKVPNGDYKVVVDTPAGHQPVTPVPVKVKNDDHKNLNLTSNIIEDVYVHITDENGAPIPGVKVTLTDVNNPGNPISGTTNSDGKVVFPDLRVGDYEITETRPDGYHSDSVEKHTVNVSGSGVKFDGSSTPDIDNTLEITNKKIAEDITIELTDDNGKPVPGADITLYDDKGNVVDTKKTDENGKVTFTNVPEGEYTIGEKSPAGYDDDPDCPIKVSVKDDGVHFNDDAKPDPDNKYEIDTAKDYYRTEVTVYVHDERKAPLANATVVIARDAAFTDVIGTTVTASNGLAVFADVAPGTYYVRESVIPTNYTCEEHTFLLVIGEDGIMTVDGKAVSNNGIYRFARRDLFITIDITNYLITAGAGAKVVDTDGDPIKDATIVITDPDGNVIGTFKTDDLGRIDIDDLPVGKYTITVTELPNGYSGAPFSRTLEVLSDGKVAVDGVTIDGAALVTFRFTIDKSGKPGVPSTGEDSNRFVPCLGTAFILTSLFALVLAGKKRKEEQDA